MLLIISFIWGSQFFFVALLIEDVGSMTLSGIKAFIGAVCLLVINLFLSKKDKSSGKDYVKLYVLIAIFEVVLPFVLIAQGQKTIPSSIAAMLIGMVPIFTILFLMIFFKKKSAKVEIISIVLGFIGIVVLSWPKGGLNNISGSIQGNVLVIIAAMSFGFSLILMEKLKKGSPIVHMRNILFIASGILIPLSFIFEQPLEMSMNTPQYMYLFILGTFHAGIVYLLFNLLIHRQGAVFTSLTNYIVPVIGIILGYFFLHEDLVAQHFIGMIIIIISLLFSNEKIVHLISKSWDSWMT